jgi:hypothetical protein
VVNSSLRVADAKAADFASAGLAWRGVAAQDAADYPMLAHTKIFDFDIWKITFVVIARSNRPNKSFMCKI